MSGHFNADFNVVTPQIEVNFDVDSPSIEANFDVQNQNIEAIFEINPVTGDKNFVHEQAVASDIWEVTHNLNKKPSITVVDSAENVVTGAYEYIDNNNVVLKFNSAFVGKAYFN